MVRSISPFIPKKIPMKQGALLILGLFALAWAQAFGDTAVAATTNEPPHLNPAITTAGPVHVVAESMYNGLVGLDREGNPIPELAERWEVRDNAKTYIFYLRRGVRWHDGKPFTAEDVKYTFDEVLLKYHARTKAGLEAALLSIETPDPQQVIFRFKFPYAPLLRRLDVTEAPILPRHLYQGTNPLTNPYNQRPVGTGPFRFAEWQRGSQVILVKNPNYFKPGLPRLEKLVFRFLPDPTAAAIALERGEVDYLGLSGPELRSLEGRPGIRLEREAEIGNNCLVTVLPNLEHPPLADRRVRQALSLAIDRSFIAERVFQGLGSPARGPITSANRPWFDPTLPPFPLIQAGPGSF